MHIDRHGILLELGNRFRRARRHAGRLLVGGAGFAAAYYLDPQNGRARRARLRIVLSQAAHRADALDATHAPVLAPLLGAHGTATEDPEDAGGHGASRPPLTGRTSPPRAAGEGGETALAW